MSRRRSTSERLEAVEKGLEVVSTTLACIQKDTQTNFCHLQALISCFFDKLVAANHVNDPEFIEETKRNDVIMSYKREWKISDFSKIQHVWTSEEFCIGHHRWKIHLHPNGHESYDDNRYASIYLVLVNPDARDPHQPVKVECRLHIKNNLYDTCGDFENFSGWFCNPYERWGFDEFVKIAEMRDPANGFVVDDRCLLETEISVLAIGEEYYFSHDC
ncbi:hypothetical protein C2S52_006098 [Perilla frutescens var. hirtella]|nr:hypothetical protein C2S52_006098 [Perilla frutescens var. hirtella]